MVEATARHAYGSLRGITRCYYGCSHRASLTTLVPKYLEL
jgi:hypothetical protein